MDTHFTQLANDYGGDAERYQRAFNQMMRRDFRVNGEVPPDTEAALDQQPGPSCGGIGDRHDRNAAPVTAGLSRDHRAASTTSSGYVEAIRICVSSGSG